MTYHILTYVLYLVVSISLTIVVGRILFKNGRIFLTDVFHSVELADSVNRLLLVGFYLINTGYITLTLREENTVWQVRELFEILSYKVGVIILVLGAMHFLNLYVFYSLRKRARERQNLYEP